MSPQEKAIHELLERVAQTSRNVIRRQVRTALEKARQSSTANPCDQEGQQCPACAKAQQGQQAKRSHLLWCRGKKLKDSSSALADQLRGHIVRYQKDFHRPSEGPPVTGTRLCLGQLSAVCPRVRGVLDRFT